MTAPYRVGYCPQCQEQMMVRDSNGKWNSFKPNFSQVYLIFNGGGTKEKILLCKSCCVSPDLQTIYESMTHQESQTYSDRRKTEERIVARGVPVGIEVRR